MTARARTKLALAALLVAPACAQILGVKEVDDSTGGAGTTSGTTTTGSGGHPSSSSSSSSTSASTTTTTTSSSSSSSSVSPCADAGAECAKCVSCMEKGACKTDYTACNNAYPCSGFLDCESNCAQDSTFSTCAVGNGCATSPDTDPGYLTLKGCVCTGCAAQCPELCK